MYRGDWRFIEGSELSEYGEGEVGTSEPKGLAEDSSLLSSDDFLKVLEKVRIGEAVGVRDPLSSKPA